MLQLAAEYVFERKIWTAKFAKVEVKGEGVLRGVYGEGSSPIHAVDDYAQQISNATIVIDATTDDRREYKLDEIVY